MPELPVDLGSEDIPPREVAELIDQYCAGLVTRVAVSFMAQKKGLQDRHERFKQDSVAASQHAAQDLIDETQFKYPNSPINNLRKRYKKYVDASLQRALSPISTIERPHIELVCDFYFGNLLPIDPGTEGDL